MFEMLRFTPTSLAGGILKTTACKITKPTFTINQISVRQKTVACKALVACGCDHVLAFNNVILPKTADSSVFVWLLSERGGGGGGRGRYRYAVLKPLMFVS